MRRKKTHILLSFVGSNDAGRLKGHDDGAILTIFKEMKFDEVYLLWNRSSKEINFKTIAEHVESEIKSRKYCKKVSTVEIDIKDVSDHNEIYPKLLDFCRSLKIGEEVKFTAAIASGTPAMQVCWILIAESGDFPLILIRSNEPKYGKPYVKNINLGTGLPRIMSLQSEIQGLKKENLNLIPKLIISNKNGEVKIGNIFIELSPIEFSYYRFFIERAKNNNDYQRFSGVTVSNEFVKAIISYHKESFPDADLFRMELEQILKSGQGLSISTFRGNISKLNKKIESQLKNPSLSNLFVIQRMGKRHSTLYGISLSSEKISIR